MVVRLITAVAAIPLILFMLFQPVPQFFCVLITVACVLGMHEMFQLLQSRGHRPYVVFGYTMAVAIHISVYQGVPRFPLSTVLMQPMALITILVMGLLLMLLARGRVEDNVVSLGFTLFAVLYVSWLSSFIIRLRAVPEGAQWVFLLIVITWVFDSGAYAWGTAFGRTKMWLDISPGKSWEGFWGGTITTLAVVWLAKEVPEMFPSLPRLFPTATNTAHLMILTILGCAAAQLGDLVESMMKRYSRLKDSGGIFPGHGGVLDRLDSFLFTGPLVFFDAIITIGLR